MLRKCYEESLFLSKEEMKRHIDQSPNWRHVPIPPGPDFLTPEEMKRHIDQSPRWGHVPIPRPFRQDLNDDELREFIDNRPDLWGSVPIPEDLLDPDFVGPRQGVGPGAKGTPEMIDQDGGYIPKMPAFPPFLRPGEVPGQQIALDEWLRRQRIQQDIEDKQRELKEVVEAIRGGPSSQIWWWLTHRNPLDKLVEEQMEKHPEVEGAGKKVLEGLPGRGGLPD